VRRSNYGTGSSRENPRSEPDLVVLDISMPGMSGIDAAAHIGKLAPATKIVMLSMHESQQLMRIASLVGPDAYIVKSSVAAQLGDTLHRLVNDGHPKGENQLSFVFHAVGNETRFSYTPFAILPSNRLPTGWHTHAVSRKISPTSGSPPVI
jgi:two-component system, NarL family, response regulator NreC